MSHISEGGGNGIEVLKLNATSPVETYALLLRHDSVHGSFSDKVSVNDNSIDLGQGPIEVISTY